MTGILFLFQVLQGTHKNLINQWRTLLSFRIFFKMSCHPISTQTLDLYAQFLSQTFKSTSSIKNYICGAKMLHILMDTIVVAFEAPELKLALRGMARLKPHCPKQAFPITPQIPLLSIHSVLDLQKTEHLVCWSLFLMAFFTIA